MKIFGKSENVELRRWHQEDVLWVKMPQLQTNL